MEVVEALHHASRQLLYERDRETDAKPSDKCAADLRQAVAEGLQNQAAVGASRGAKDSEAIEAPLGTK